MSDNWVDVWTDIINACVKEGEYAKWGNIYPTVDKIKDFTVLFEPKDRVVLTNVDNIASDEYRTKYSRLCYYLGLLGSCWKYETDPKLEMKGEVFYRSSDNINYIIRLDNGKNILVKAENLSLEGAPDPEYILYDHNESREKAFRSLPKYDKSYSELKHGFAWGESFTEEEETMSEESNNFVSFTFQTPDRCIHCSPVPEECEQEEYYNYRELWISPFVNNWDSSFRKMNIYHPTVNYEGDGSINFEKATNWFKDMGPILAKQNAKVLDMTVWRKNKPEEKKETENEQEAFSTLKEFLI